MPNTFAYVALFAWPFVVLLLFRVLRAPDAVVWSIVGGYLFLPFGVGIDIGTLPGMPSLPYLDKVMVPSLSVLMVLLFSLNRRDRSTRIELLTVPAGDGNDATLSATPIRRRVGQKVAAPTSRGIAVEKLCLFLSFATPLLTIIQNPEPVIAGSTVLPGLGASDATLMIGTVAVALIPYLLARRFLAGEDGQISLLWGLSVSAAVYSLPTLFEARMSPQLSRMFYGFLYQPFDQTLRGGGFRPVVFLQHGLWLAIFMAMALLAAVALWRTLRPRGPWLAMAVWLFLTLILCRSLGALAIALVLLPIGALMPARSQVTVAALVAIMFLAYPALRGVQLIPVNEIAALAETVNQDRADSLTFRLKNEDALLARANEKPLAGWGGWGRYRVFDQDTGRDTSITDGIWIITLGVSGWFGYIGQYGLLTMPILLLLWRGRDRSISYASAGLCLALIANLIDLIPNASLTPITWLIAGALMGRVRQVDSPHQKVSGASQRPGRPRARPAKVMTAK